MTKPTTVEEHIAALEEPAASRMRELRALARDAVSAASEALEWGAPALIHPSGTILLIISAHRKHTHITFAPSTREAFDEELTEHETGKGASSCPMTRPCRLSCCAG